MLDIIILFANQRNKTNLTKKLNINKQHKRFMTSGKMPPSLGGNKQPKLPVENKSGDNVQGTPKDPLSEHQPSALNLIQDSTKTPLCDYTPTTKPPAPPSPPPSFIDTGAGQATQKALATAQTHEQFKMPTPVILEGVEPLSPTSEEVKARLFTTATTNNYNDIIPVEKEEALSEILQYDELLPESPIPELSSSDIIAVAVTKDTRDANGDKLLPHEQEHALVSQFDKKKGIYYADHILTSSKKNTVTGQKNPVLDTQNNFKGETKPQRVAELKTGRMFFEHDKGSTFEIQQDATQYLQQSHIKPKIETIIKTSPKPHRTVRLPKDDPQFFTEDGLSHADDAKVQRGPWTEDTISVTETTPQKPEIVSDPEANKDVIDIDYVQDSTTIVD